MLIATTDALPLPSLRSSAYAGRVSLLDFQAINETTPQLFLAISNRLLVSQRNEQSFVHLASAHLYSYPAIFAGGLSVPEAADPRV